MKALLAIFSEFFRISLFVIGGGYSILVIADRRFAKIGWTAEGEIIDHLPVFQTVPGLIATHTAVYVGRKRAGVLGAVVAVTAVAIPAVAIFTGVTVCYRMIPLDNPWLQSAFIGLRAALTGIIAATVVSSWRRNLPDAFAYALMTAGVLAVGYFHIHIAFVLVAAMLLGTCVVRARRVTFQSSWLALLLFAQYGALCFGGGFVIVPMYLHDFIGSSAPYLQIAENEFGDIMALSQMTPGPIGVNCATFFGYRIAGVAGALAASAMLLLPGSVLAYAALSSLEKFRTSRTVQGIMRGIRPASIALMLVALFAFAKMTVFCDNVFRPWGLVLTLTTMVLTMNKKINVILLIVLCAFAGSALRADVTAREYPDADTVVLDAREEIEYFPDGTYKSVEESWEKALTEKGRRNLSSAGMDYSQRYGAAKFVEVAIISPDGTKKSLDLNGLIKESTENSSMSANIYDPLDKQILCNIPGVKVNDTVYIKRERSTFAARCQNQWAGFYSFEGFRPAIRDVVMVKCPKERPLKNIAIRNPIGNIVHSAVTNDDGSVVMEWCATNSPQAFWEPSAPSVYKHLQHLVVSTAKDWREMSKWYWELCAPHLAKTNAAMVAKVNELKSKVEGNKEKLLAEIFKFVSQEVRYMGLTMEDKSPGYAPHDVNITFDKRYGVCRDKAGLLAAMLRLGGFEAYPVLIMAGSSKMDADVPSPYFNHAIVAVAEKEKGKYILMDPTNESTKDFLPSYESDCSYLVARPDGEGLLTTPMPDAEENMLAIDSDAMLSADGSMFVESKVTFKGLNDTVFRQWMLGMKPTERRQFFENRVSSVYPGTKIVKLDIEPKDLQDVSQNLSAKFSVQVPEMYIRGKTGIRFSVRWLTDAITLGIENVSRLSALEKRRFPLRMSSTAGVRENLRIDLGGHLGEPEVLPACVDITGGYEYRCSASVTNGEYIASRVVKLNTLEFSPAEYLDLRENLKRIEAAKRKRPVFADNRFANADIHSLFVKKEFDFGEGNSWVVTNTAVTRILTYDGKKSYSEFKLEYNPLIEKVKVLKASVTSPKGGTTLLSDKEITELDCDWAAGAPRYPASKIMVLTLPSVEIGSVISSSVELVTTDSPVAFRNRFFLDTTEPVDELYIRVGKDVHDVIMPDRIPDEDEQPAGKLWRKNFVVDRGTFAATCATLRKAAEVEPLDPSVLNLNLQPQPSLKAIRDWMAKHVRIVGPSLYELPIEKQLTDPAVVVKERYASRLDYVRTLCALLKGAGYKADVVFASGLRVKDERYPSAYDIAVCRVDGMLIGTENEYSPLGSTKLDGHWYLDPVAEKETFFSVEDTELCDFRSESVVITVRPNGAVDYDREVVQKGEIGGVSKYYAEILPEMRSRVFQTHLGRTAQAATATSEFVTENEGSKFRLAYSCFIPDYAVVEGDTITLKLPNLFFGFSVAGETRRSPLTMNAGANAVDTYKVVFPEGYDKIEKLPDSIVIHDPRDPSKIRDEVKVGTSVENGRLVVTLKHIVHELDEAVFVPAEYFSLLRDWTRRSRSPAALTITVRR